MIFPVTGFPVIYPRQQQLPKVAFKNARVFFSDFTGATALRSAAPDADELFILKAAWLSELLFRILSRADFGIEPQEETRKQCAQLLAVSPAEANLALCGLLWLSHANPLLKTLAVFFSGTEKIFDIAFLLRSARGRALYELLLRAKTLDEQIEALLEQYPDLLSEEERLLFLRILRYAAGARWQLGGEPQYGHDVPHGEAINRSSDRDWMHTLVLVAKIVPVWLADIRRRYQVDVWRLDAIPDAELDHLESLGINGIWLVGLWQRSPASARIKVLTGGKNYASAYSVFDYRVADEWGGEEALARFHARCAARGIRLGCDMVPNHTGIDSRWLRENPDDFMQVDFCPFPNYQFSGENLSGTPEMQIRIEDGYYRRSDAAVVFALDYAGRRRYIYHGNDGTGLPWNDTAQLDHTRAAVRQKIIETALSLSRYFSVIRFDAAMTLTRMHYRRLWFPDPTSHPAIASRAAFALTQSEFDARMPREFWTELVEAFRAHSPDTLLIAEAFWMTEMYFVRNLGMHRVYNSAFMHCLRDEKNVQFEKTLRDFRAHDPETLRRFVNYLSTPDEESAQTHFPHADKYFGAMVLMATLPGLPMLAPGQTEGYREKYGMDQDAPLSNEAVDEYLVSRHRREITPLLKRRWEFADPLALSFPQVEKPDHVLCYTTGKSERFLVAFNNSPQRSEIRIAPGDFLALFPNNTPELTWKELLRGEICQRERNDIEHNGFLLTLEPYGCVVFSEFGKIVQLVKEEKKETMSFSRFPKLGEYLSGMVVPVAALRSQQSCGIGEFYDLKLLVDWCKHTGHNLIALLPINDSWTSSCPYAALSAHALHPVYINLDALNPDEKIAAAIAAERSKHATYKRVRFSDIAAFKEKILRQLYEREPEAAMASVPIEFASQRWLRDYAIFRHIKAYFGGRAWFEWDATAAPSNIQSLLANPVVEARDAFFEQNHRELFFYVWVQYLLDRQLTEVRDYATSAGVYLKGDMPILLERDSVDVWLNPQLFNTRLRAGAPPDMFSPEGQNWGLPVYNWVEHEREDFRWWRSRIHQLERYFGAYRIDHVLGFFRIWSIEENNRSGIDGFFQPSLPLSADEFQNLCGSREIELKLSAIEIYPEESKSLPPKAKDRLLQIGEKLFLPQELTNETSIQQWEIPEALKGELLRRLHARAFIRYENSLYPGWEFSERLAAMPIAPEIKTRLTEAVASRRPREQEIQEAQGRKILSLLKNGSAMLPCAEDLGVVPDYVRPALAELGILGLKVYRWETENGVPKDPAGYPYLAVATSSVHDSSNLREWLANEAQTIPGFNHHAAVADIGQILGRLYASPAMLALIPLQDLLALEEKLHGDPKEERINIPGTVSDFNWTYRMPLYLEELLAEETLNQKIRNLTARRPQ